MSIPSSLACYQPGILLQPLMCSVIYLSFPCNLQEQGHLNPNNGQCVYARFIMYCLPDLHVITYVTLLIE